MVERIGCRARHAINGRTGLELIAEEIPDLVLLDLMMPDMNGPRFLQELRKTHRTLPVVIVTGHSDSDLMTQAAQFGPLMLLSKPVERVQLEQVVRMAQGTSRKEMLP